jgi:hypothetical protein
MEKRGALTKILAIAGTVLVWFPIVAPVLFSVAAIIGERRFLFDYLMPAELFQFALIGSGLLFWAARRARSQQQKLIVWSLVLAAGFFVGGQVLAMVTGLDSRGVEPTGWPLVLVMGSLIVYTLAMVAIGVGGILLIRDLFKPPKKS